MTTPPADAPVTPVRRALVSVYDKTGLPELARGLVGHGVKLVSTGSTAEAIRSAGVAVTEVSAVTGFPEIMDGRVKTLHPAVHGGILADRSVPAHNDALREHGIEPLDLVVCNLYPFADALAAGADERQAVEMIDVGGPAMVRAAAKNHAHVTVVVDAADYAAVLAELGGHGGVTAATRRRLAARAFAHTADYDADVAAWMVGGAAGEQPDADAQRAFPGDLRPRYRLAQALRYGENPHQRAAYYVEAGVRWGLGSARQLHGRELSYNNLLDADAAWAMAVDFKQPCVAIVKHNNPCGLALGQTLAQAYPLALAGDPTSRFGGIVAVNRPLDGDTARQIVADFTEVVVAPGYSDEALAVLRERRNVRVLAIERPEPPGPVRQLRSVSGGLLAQDADAAPEQPESWTVPTRAEPGDELLDELRFAWTVCKHTKSNAIVLTRDRAAVGVGAGQMSRVDSVRIAVAKSEGRCEGAVLASDALFPFRDGPDVALDAGVVALVQPGGSMRDAEVIAACDERGVPMVFTGRRHFRH